MHRDQSAQQHGQERREIVRNLAMRRKHLGNPRMFRARRLLLSHQGCGYAQQQLLRIGVRGLAHDVQDDPPLNSERQTSDFVQSWVTTLPL